MNPTVSFKKLNQLAIPTLTSCILATFLSITDLIILANIDHNAIASIRVIGIVAAFLSMLIWVFIQTRNAISATLSQYLAS